jgi:predicted PurR-regulated permease PerM
MIPTLILAWIVFVLLWKILKTTIKTALTLAAILVLLHISFGITPQDIWDQIINLPQTFSQIRSGK